MTSAIPIAWSSRQSFSLLRPLVFNKALANNTIHFTGAGLVGFALGGCGDIALTYVQDSYDGVRDCEYDLQSTDTCPTDMRDRSSAQP